MNVKRSLAALAAAVAVLAGATGCSSNTSSGVIDTKADKGLAVLGDHVTYDPNHLVNDGQPIELGYWSWGDASTDPVITMLHKYEKIHPNVTFKISQVAWSDYWVKTPLSLKGNKNAPVLFNVHNSQDALLRPHMAAYDIDLKDLEADYTNVVQTPHAPRARRRPVHAQRRGDRTHRLLRGVHGLPDLQGVRRQPA